MVALGLWTGTASDEELATEVTRFGSESLYAARLANALMGATQNLVLDAEQAATDAGASPEQIDAARKEAFPAGKFERGSALAAFLRWQVLRLALVLRQVNQDYVGPVWLAAAHAGDGLQLLLNVCGIARMHDPQYETLPEDLTAAMEAFANARTNIEILMNLCGSSMPQPSYARPPGPRGHALRPGRPLGTLTGRVETGSRSGGGDCRRDAAQRRDARSPPPKDGAFGAGHRVVRRPAPLR
jgi:hypothetical protein